MKINSGDIVKILCSVGSSIIGKKTLNVDCTTKVKVGIVSEACKYGFSHTMDENAKAVCTIFTSGGCMYFGAEVGAIVGTGIGFMIGGPLGASMGYTLGVTTGATSGTIGGLKISKKIRTQFFDMPETNDNKVS